MDSEIWRVRTEKIGSLEPFKSERDMESFLMNNPAVVGCWDPNEYLRVPSLVRQQISIRSEAKRGRMDMVGVALKDDSYELRIFELKPDEIQLSAVDQINSYIETWKQKSTSKKDIAAWIESLGIPDLDEATINKIMEKPVPVLVGPTFHPEALAEALKNNVRCVRLTRFRSVDRAEYYVIVEDQVGSVVSARRGWSWREMIDKGLINADDIFTVAYKGNKVSVKPAPKFLNYIWTYVVFDEDSTKLLLEKKKQILAGSKEHPYSRKWLETELDALKTQKPMVITHASALFQFAFGSPYPSWFWTPTGMWRHEKSGKTLDDLKADLFG